MQRISFKIGFIFLVFLLTVACEKETKTTLRISNHSEEFKGVCREGSCAEVLVDYIKIDDTTEAASKINYVIGGSIIYFLNADIEKKISATTLAEAAKRFLKEYENDVKQFPEISPYTAETSASKSYVSPTILSVETNYSNVTGGAHGYEKVGFLNFDPATGLLIRMPSLFKNIDEFTPFAEKYFRKKYGIAETEKINSKGNWFRNDTFHLPLSIGFSEEFVILRYNPDEIASFAEGVIEVLIPMEEAKPYLNF